MAISKNKHFSWNFSTGDVESSWQKPSDILSKKCQKILPHSPTATKHKFFGKLILQTFCMGTLSVGFTNLPKKFRQKPEKLVSISQIDEKIQSYSMEKLSYLNVPSNALSAVLTRQSGKLRWKSENIPLNIWKTLQIICFNKYVFSFKMFVKTRRTQFWQLRRKKKSKNGREVFFQCPRMMKDASFSVPESKTFLQIVRSVSYIALLTTLLVDFY